MPQSLHILQRVRFFNFPRTSFVLLHCLEGFTLLGPSPTCSLLAIERLLRALDMAPASGIAYRQMRIEKLSLVAAVIFALAVYVVDCSPMSPEEAMQCCDSMPCSSHSHDQAQDCCKAMSSTHAPFVQPSSTHGSSFASAIVAILPTPVEPSMLVPSCHVIQQSHAPPILSAPASAPLRI